MPIESLTLEMPTHLDRADRPLFGRTTRELLVLTGGLFTALGTVQQAHVALGLRLGEGLLVAVLAALLVWCRPAGRSLVTWGRVVLAHVTGPRTLAWNARRTRPLGDGGQLPPHLAPSGWLVSAVPAPSPAPATPSPRGRPAIQGQRFVPVCVAEGIVTFGDGRRCAVLECGGENIGLMDTETLRAVHGSYHAFLAGLSFPVQLLVYTTPVDLRTYGVARGRRLAELPLALRRLESADTAYMEREARRRGLLDHRVFVIIPAPEQDSVIGSPLARGPRALLRGRLPVPPVEDDVPRLLHARSERTMADLGAARVHVWRPTDAELEELWYRLLCPRTSLLQPWDPGHAAPVVWPTITFPQRGEGDADA